jgi:phospholipid N-methyltransferase
MSGIASRPQRAPGPLRQLGLFLLNFLRHPLSVGTFVPSSPFLVKRLLKAADWSQVRTVVEYGPGVGTITEPLLRHLAPDARLLAIETNADFCRYLERHLGDPRLIVAHRSAEAILSLMEEHGLPPADMIVSGIPFTTLPPPVRERILDATVRALDRSGHFLVYQYTRAVERHLRQRFRAVSRSVEWRNPWPIQVFVCEGPGAV